MHQIGHRALPRGQKSSLALPVLQLDTGASEQNITLTLHPAGKLNKENGWSVRIHVDAASGGFVAPFIYPDLKWDFVLPNVCPLPDEAEC